MGMSSRPRNIGFLRTSRFLTHIARLHQRSKILMVPVPGLGPGQELGQELGQETDVVLVPAKVLGLEMAWDHRLPKPGTR